MTVITDDTSAVVRPGLHWPAIVVPMGFTGEDLPSGLQIVGRPFDEETLFAASRVIEQSSGMTFEPDKWW